MENDDKQVTPTDHTDASSASKPLFTGLGSDAIDLGFAPQQGGMHQDFTEILKEIKLPERHEFTAQGDTKKQPEETPPPVEPEPVKPTPVIKSQSNSDPMSAVTPLRTLKNDLQDVVRDNKMSLVKAVSLEQDKRRRGSIDEHIEQSTTRHKRTFGTLFAITLFFGLGGAALLGVYIVTQQNKGPAAASVSSAQTILFAENTIGLSANNLTPDALKQQLAGARDASTGAVGSITRIVPLYASTTASGAQSQTALTLRQFLSSIGAQAPDDLVRALGPDFFFGIHTVDKNSPVLVIPVTSYDHAFAGMLTWEKTLDMDLAPVFPQVPVLKTDANGLPINRTFEDAVMNNYDVRVLKDDSGVVQLYYSFPRPNILIIATSPYTYSEVLSRLQSARKL